MSVSFDDLTSRVKVKYSDKDIQRLKKAFEFSAKAHYGQVRQTGEPYISHSLFVADILAQWGLDLSSLEAALLHDIPEMTEITISQIETEFGSDVSQLVDGVSRVGQVKLRGSHDSEFLENLRKMFVYLAQDLRVVLIRLADRLHNLTTLEAVPLSKQKRIALETIEVYAPLAERLGMGKLKGDLEDLSFPYIYPEEYQWVMEIAKPHFKYSQENVSDVIQKIHQQLAKHKLRAKVEGRFKRKYSLYKKLLRPEINRDIKQIYDLMAIRIITKDTSECYAILGIIHQYWKPAPHLGISDFISQPKPNGYQSIHTKVFDNKGNIVEIQIRSEAMHLQAEYGAAAHFAYSEAKNNGATDEMLLKGINSSLGTKMAWVNQLAGWKNQFGEDREQSRSYRLDALSKHIYVFSPKGDVYDLPEGATPVDFAFNVHSALGQSIHSSKVNGKIVPLDYNLKSGDLVEILKTKSPKKPNKDWLRFVRTPKARFEIRRLNQDKHS